MLSKLWTWLTGINPQVIVVVVILALSGWAYLYVQNLKSEITDRNNTIISLQTKLNDQNTAIIQAGKDKTNLETVLANVRISNGRLQKEVDRLNGNIFHQPPAKNCDEALSRISNNAEELAKGWNK